jgi:hypothetical protein
LSQAEPDAYFHVISKDTGFDPLIAHLKSRKILAARWKDVAEIPFVRTANAKAPTDRLAAIIANLRQRGASKPRTVKTLSSTINALFQKSISETEVKSLLDSLQGQGVISVAGEKVSYALPEAGS